MINSPLVPDRLPPTTIFPSGVTVTACAASALWRSAASLTLCVALVGSVAAVLSVRGGERPVPHWITVAVLIALSVVTLGACLVRACREPDAATWAGDEPVQQHVPDTAE